MYHHGNTSALRNPDIDAVSNVDAVLNARVLVETELTPRPSARTGNSATLLRDIAPARLSIRLADTEGHRSDASFLVRKLYGWRGYLTDDDPDAQPNCVTLVAFDGVTMLATITVGFGSEADMAVGALYPEQVSRLRDRGADLCEFTRLAVDRNDYSRELLAMMFHVAYMYARRLHGSTDLLIEVNPRHVGFYKRMLGFRQLGSERICPRVNAPAVLLWLPLKDAEEQIALYGGHGEVEGVRSLYPLFFSPTEEEGILGRLRTID